MMTMNNHLTKACSRPGRDAGKPGRCMQASVAAKNRERKKGKCDFMMIILLVIVVVIVGYFIVTEILL